MNYEIREVENEREGHEGRRIPSRCYEIQKLGIFFGAELRMMDHMADGVMVRNRARNAAQIAGKEISRPAEWSEWRKNSFVGCPFVHGEYRQGIHHPTAHGRRNDTRKQHPP